MDELRPQSHGLQVKEGHQEVDFNVRVIVISVVFLAVATVLVILLAVAIMRGLEWWEQQHDAQLTPVQEQLNRERAIPKKPEGLRPPPDWDERAQQESHLEKTFPTPRLQYDEVRDMSQFRSAEDEHLNSTGKNPDGTVHIPISRAMELLSKEGLPQVSGPFEPTVSIPVEAAKPVLPMSTVQSGTRKAGQ
ncbi:MAG TPA: hypothetical protein VHA33_28145 [Candidatus Angelobacter sp.]|jgi:hypothetical protein|nr:hypothetical protein [Candidatus Angelobacter sp.]